MFRRFRIGQLFGIPIYLHASWFLALFFFTYVFSTLLKAEVQPVPREWLSLSVAALTTCLVFVSVLLHELGHSLVALHYKLPVRSITLFIFGGVAQLDHEVEHAKEEFFIAIAGPLTSALIGAAAFGAMQLSSTQPLLAWGVKQVMQINLAIAVFNLLPGFPLDGGRILRALLWWRTQNLVQATQIAGRSGQIIAFALIGLGLLMTFTSGQWSGDGLYPVLVGWYLLLAANSTVRQTEITHALHDVFARDLSSARILRIDGQASLRQLVELLVQNGERWALVTRDAQPFGLVTLSDVRRIAPQDWPTTTALLAATPLEHCITATPDTPAQELLGLMLQNGIAQIPILAEKQLVGAVNLSDLARESART